MSHDSTDPACLIFNFFQDANFAIVLEEDLDISIDFFRYVLQKAQLLLRAGQKLKNMIRDVKAEEYLTAVSTSCFTDSLNVLSSDVFLSVLVNASSLNITQKW